MNATPAPTATTQYRRYDPALGASATQYRHCDPRTGLIVVTGPVTLTITEGR